MIHATSIPWKTRAPGPRYGPELSYRLAAKWLEPCDVVADWGGGRGYLSKFVNPLSTYRLIDGTLDPKRLANLHCQIVNLATYVDPSEGICLRHVLEMTPDWAAI